MVEAAPKQPTLPGLDGPSPPAEPAARPPGHALPGRRAGLAEDALTKPYPGVQGDENRDPPANAPAPVPPPRRT